MANLPSGIPVGTVLASAFPAAVAMVGDLISEIAPSGAQWGLFSQSGGGQAITADSVVSFAHRQEWTISDYPVERGGFQTFDKVLLPFDVRLRFSAGSSAARAALLSSIDAVAGTTELFDAVTPDAVYTDVNVTHYDYDRAAQKGVGLLQIDVWCLNINQSATMSASGGPATASGSGGGPAASPASADPSSGGAVGGSYPDFISRQSVGNAPILANANTAYSP